MKKPASPPVAPATAHRPPRRAAGSERGASAVEYGLLIAGIAGVLVLVIVLLGGSVRGMFDDTCDAVGKLSASTCS